MNYAVLCDLNSIKISFKTFIDAVNGLDGKVYYSKFYGYVAKRNNDFSEYIKTHSSDVSVPLQNRKKVKVDIRQVIDSIEIACTNKSIDAFFIICSEVDALPMIQALKRLNKHVVLGVLSSSFLSEQADSAVILERAVEAAVDEFLPYSKVLDDSNELKEVKEELNQLINQKMKQIEKTSIDTSGIDVEKLIKKYF